MKEPKITLRLVILIPKVDTYTQVPSEINPYESVIYIYASHDTCLRSRRSVGSCVITLFGTASLYYKSNLQSTVPTSSTEAGFMASICGSKYAKYISSILEELLLPRQGPTQISCDKTEAIITENLKKPTEISRHIDVQYFILHEWVYLRQIILEHFRNHLNLSDTSIKSLEWVLHNRHTCIIMGEYGSKLMQREWAQKMVLGEVEANLNN